MATFRTACTNLSNLSVTGIIHNYDVNEVPDSLHRAQLPALLVLPIDIQDDNPATESSAGIKTVAFSDGGQSVVYMVTHLLLIAPLSASKGIRAHLPTLIDSIDNYFSALGADVTVSDSLLEPVQVHVEPGIFTFNDIPYIGCAFRHTWMLEI